MTTTGFNLLAVARDLESAGMVRPEDGALPAPPERAP